MVATVNIQFVDPPDPNLSSVEPVRAALVQAFNEWTRHFDFSTGVYAVGVSFKSFVQPIDVNLGGGQYPTPVSSNLVDIEPSLGLAVTGRATPPPDQLTLTLDVNPGYLTGALSLANLAGPIERVFGHALGITADQRNIVTGSLRLYTFSVYDLSAKFVQRPPNAVTTFNGPNAEAVYGSPVPVDNGRPDVTTVGGGATVDTTAQPASALQPLDVALLRDAGLPALSDQELGEHQIARVYVAAFGRNADSAGLIQQYGALRTGETLAQVANGFTSSAEFANRYGSLSNTDFLNALYQNVLGRSGDAAGLQFYQGLLTAGVSRGTVLTAFSDSDEERGRATVDPNIIYAATAEAQVARLYDTAFGRDADPQGFVLATPAVINGVSLQQLAIGFIGSAEFASRYGSALSSTALVDALYANTLHRPADPAGEALFVQALNSGQLSQANLIVTFSESQEHISLLAQRSGARDAAGYNINLLPHLGFIPEISVPVKS